VTTGLLRRLDTEELEGVLSHELSHVAHKDVSVMTIASFLGVLAGLATRVLAEVGLFGGFGGRDNRDGGESPAAIAALVMLVSAIVYGISFLLIRTLSRYRELSADRSGALLTGNPSGLASALVKISGDISRIPTGDLRKEQAFNAFFFTPAIGRGASVSTLFSTDPSLQVRLDRLGRIAAELGR
jgi:heat shock protein HtpX